MRSPDRILLTGGAGFIGSALVRYLIKETDVRVVNVDSLTYAGNPASLVSVSRHSRYYFERADVCDPKAMADLFRKHRPDAVIHLAAESHVDRSIDGPAEFVRTNIVGTYTLLETAFAYWRGLDEARKRDFLFHHVSTDEVFGSLPDEGYFTEESAYRPSSPYAASKASADHLVRAWHRTFGMPVVITNCSNNFGPYQFPEKLIPLMIISATSGKRLPVYGSGDNVRDWLYVDDHVRALWRVLTCGRGGETYNIGANSERTNLEVVHAICAILDQLLPDSPFFPHTSLISFVPDRPGHDLRYAIDAGRIRRELGWEPLETFDTGLRKTVSWYLNNQSWWRNILTGAYRGERLGLTRNGAENGELDTK